MGLRFALTDLLREYGLVLVLGLLCLVLSLITLTEYRATGISGALQLAPKIESQFGSSARILIVATPTPEDHDFAVALQEMLSASGTRQVATVEGDPGEARKVLEQRALSSTPLDVIACTPSTRAWLLFDSLANDFPSLAGAEIVAPHRYVWPSFLTTDNLLNIANQVTVIAILAIGMTMVVITAGIDLSVGSLVALSAMVSTLLIRELAGAREATWLGMIPCCLAGIAVCAGLGAFNGVMVAFCRLPPFIVTLSMMLIASGFAFLLTRGESVAEVPASFVWLGGGADLWHIPNAVVLMLLLYGGAHVLMAHTVLGRYLYAVGGNVEAARLSGVPVSRVKLFAYTASGLFAGLGGVVLASRLKSAAPPYGQMYELYVIAAVVVGGTSLMGGEGRIFGTLLGVFLIAVIQNGMNLTNVDPYTQKVVLGAVILVAVLLDQLKGNVGGPS